jgi:hypothetical protein
LWRFAGSAIAQGFWESIEPIGIFGLQSNEHGDRVGPAPGAAAAISGVPVVDYRPGCGVGSAMPSLALGIGHRPVAQGCAWHGVHSKALRNGT